MSNFKLTYLKGKAGGNFGLQTGLLQLDEAINGIQKKTSIGLAAAPKVGKTTLADFSFVISPYLQMEREGRLSNIHWIYFSGEIDRVSKEFKFAAHFMAHDYGVHIITHRGKMYQMSDNYLLGRLMHRIDDEHSELVPVTTEHEDMLKEVYIRRIVPLFGEYDEKGERIREGKIDFIEEMDNPTGMYKYLMAYARDNGEFIKTPYQAVTDGGGTETRWRVTSYHERNPSLFTIIVTDHVRKLRRERGFTMKENIDKWLEYSTFLRNMCQFTFINICHSNRGVANVDRLRMLGEFIFPTADDVKDTGNLAEESTILMTMFNPHDEKYNLQRHFGTDLTAYPNYRSIHITESRYTECPVHIQTNMYGGTNTFTPLNTY